MLDRTKVTFAQAEGVEPLPTQLDMRTISAEMKAALWFIVHEFMKEDIEPHYDGSSVISGEWRAIMLNWFITREHGMIDDFPESAAPHLANAKARVTSDSYVKVFEFLQYVVRSYYCPRDFPKAVQQTLERTRAGWRLVDDTFFPFASDEEAKTVERAFDLLEAPGLSAPRSHLKKAGERLGAGRWADSARESIHAVEAAAKILDAKASTLSDALKRIRNGGTMNPNLRAGLLSLYNWTSDEGGIRHALVDGPDANVTEADALFMIGACASFITYLLGSAKSSSAN